MWYRVLSLSVIGLGLGLFGLLPGAAAQERGRADTESGKRLGTATRFQGTIARVDFEKRMLVLKDARPSSTGTDRGKGSSGTGSSGTGTSGTSGTGTAGRDTRGTGAGMMHFQVARDAQITLDGKKADLNDLKEGFRANVEVKAGTGTSGSGTSGTGKSGSGTSGSGTSGTGKAGTAERDTGGTATHPLMAIRVEAFSRNTGTGRPGKGERP